MKLEMKLEKISKHDKVNRDNLIDYLLNLQFKASGLKHLNHKVCYDSNEEYIEGWYDLHTLTIEQYRYVRSKAVNTISRVLRRPKYKGRMSAQHEFDNFMMSFGFKYDFTMDELIEENSKRVKRY